MAPERETPSLYRVERAAYPDKVGTLVAGMNLERDSITERLEELRSP